MGEIAPRVSCFQGGVMINRQTGATQRASGVPALARWLGGVALGAMVLALGDSGVADAFTFTPGDLVISVEGNGAAGPNSTGGPYADNQGAPLSLWEYSLTATTSAGYAGELVLPQASGAGGNTAASNGNFPISGEYGSSSEGTLQLTGNGQYLTIAGYGISANTYNSDQDKYNVVPGNTKIALGQTGSLSSYGANAVPRVVALVGANGGVNTSTAVYGVFNENNPRSVYSLNGTTFYISGQGDTATNPMTGSSLDNTGGVFVTTLGGHSATSITGNDAGSGASQEANDVQIYNNTLYVSTDSKEGSNNRDFIGTLGSPPTTASNAPYNGGAGPTQLNNFGTSGAGKETITTGANSNGNGLNNFNSTVEKINLSPQNYFFANADTLYVADSGDPKNDSNGDDNSTGKANIGDGGLQKWTLNTMTGMWTLDYTLYAGLNLVNNGSTTGVSGLYGLTGEVIGGSVELFATSYTLADTAETYLYGITDTLADTKASQVTGETFSVLATAPADDTFKGVAFAPEGADPLTPTPLPASWTFMLIGLAGFGLARLRRNSNGRRPAAA
jgi:hypothetical protein